MTDPKEKQVDPRNESHYSNSYWRALLFCAGIHPSDIKYDPLIKVVDGGVRYIDPVGSDYWSEATFWRAKDIDCDELEILSAQNTPGADK